LEAKTRMAALVAWIQGIQSITSMANTKKRVHISPPFAGTRNYPISPRIYNKTPSSLHKLTHFLPKPSFSHHSIYKSTQEKNEIDSGARGRSHKKHIHNTLSSHTPSRSQPHTAWECLVRCASVWVPLYNFMYNACIFMYHVHIMCAGAAIHMRWIAADIYFI
jgi:hypothetical protein